MKQKQLVDFQNFGLSSCYFCWTWCPQAGGGSAACSSNPRPAKAGGGGGKRLPSPSLRITLTSHHSSTVSKADLTGSVHAGLVPEAQTCSLTKPLSQPGFRTSSSKPGAVLAGWFQSSSALASERRGSGTITDVESAASAPFTAEAGPQVDLLRSIKPH